MITCYVHYQVDSNKLEEFEAYANVWIPLVERFGGKHHGYFLPSEGPSDLAVAAFSFNSMAEYEKYRKDSVADADCQRAFEFARKTKCILRYDRHFLRPVLDGDISALDKFD